MRPMDCGAGRRARAFTLIEMLVVIAVMGMLAAIVGAVLLKARRTSVRLQCAENLRHIGTGFGNIVVERGGAFPALYGTDASDVPYADVDDAGAMPWWAVVLDNWRATKALDTDATNNVLDLPPSLPRSMRSFHCRAAPPLVNPGGIDDPLLSTLESVHRSISYGMNYDFRQWDGEPAEMYEARVDASGDYILGGSAAYPELGGEPTGTAKPLDADDLRPDLLYSSHIARPAEFILVADADVENGTGGRIRSQAAARVGTDEIDVNDWARVIGRHDGKANVLFADYHVELMEAPTVAEADELGGTENEDVEWTGGDWTKAANRATPYWTLPND